MGEFHTRTLAQCVDACGQAITPARVVTVPTLTPDQPNPIWEVQPIRGLWPPRPPGLRAGASDETPTIEIVETVRSSPAAYVLRPRPLRAHFEKARTTMATGTVKWFNSQKGFGFIQPADGSKDVFVHITAVERAGLPGLTEGQKVNYEVGTERGKAAAINLSAA